MKVDNVPPWRLRSSQLPLMRSQAISSLSETIESPHEQDIQNNPSVHKPALRLLCHTHQNMQRENSSFVPELQARHTIEMRTGAVQGPYRARDQRELIEVLGYWLRDHPDELLPGMLRKYLTMRIKSSKKMFISKTSEAVWVERIRINGAYWCWSMKNADGTYMFVKNVWGGGRGCHRYQAWLGGDYGFGDSIVARTYESPARDDSLQVNNNNEAFPNLSKRPLPRGTRARGTRGRNDPRNAGMRRDRERYYQALYASELNTSRIVDRHGIPNPDNISDDESNSLKVFAVEEEDADGVGPASDRSVGVDPSSPFIHEKSSRSNLSKDTQKITKKRHDDSPRPITLSDFNKDKRPRLSPRTPRSSSEDIDPIQAQRPPKRRRRVVSSPLMEIKRSRSPSTELLSAQLTMGGPSMTGTPQFSALAEISSIPSESELPLSDRITFRFFSSNPSFGAVPQRLSQCTTAVSFFDEAFMAWCIFGGEEQNSRIGGVSIAYEGMKVPMIVPWRNNDGFERMVEEISEAALAWKGRLDVQVKCIKHT